MTTCFLDLGPSKQIIKKTFSTWSNEQGERRTVAGNINIWLGKQDEEN